MSARDFFGVKLTETVVNLTKLSPMRTAGDRIVKYRSLVVSFTLPPRKFYRAILVAEELHCQFYVADKSRADGRCKVKLAFAITPEVGSIRVYATLTHFSSKLQ